jgi:hypothetical protein
MHAPILKGSSSFFSKETLCLDPRELLA